MYVIQFVRWKGCDNFEWGLFFPACVLVFVLGCTVDVSDHVCFDEKETINNQHKQIIIYAEAEICFKHLIWMRTSKLSIYTHT